MYGYIYKTTNLINGKIYVGQHKGSEFDRKYYGSGTILKQAINKYGIENFKCEILEWCKNLKTINEREIYWIAEFDSTNKEIGYNICEGGGGISGYTHSKETKKKIGEKIAGRFAGELNPMYGVSLNPWNKGLTAEDDNRVVSGERHGMYGTSPRAWNKGVVFTEEQKKECRLSQPSRMPLIVTNLDDGEMTTFDSIKEASDILNIPRRTIGTNLNKNNCYIRGNLKFEFKEKEVA